MNTITREQLKELKCFKTKGFVGFRVDDILLCPTEGFLMVLNLNKAFALEPADVKTKEICVEAAIKYKDLNLVTTRSREVLENLPKPGLYPIGKFKLETVFGTLHCNKFENKHINVGVTPEPFAVISFKSDEELKNWIPK